MRLASALLILLMAGCALKTQSTPGSTCRVTAEQCDHCEMTCEHTRGAGGEAAVGETIPLTP